jgi:hypothetical protein
VDELDSAAQRFDITSCNLVALTAKVVYSQRVTTVVAYLGPQLAPNSALDACVAWLLFERNADQIVYLGDTATFEHAMSSLVLRLRAGKATLRERWVQLAHIAETAQSEVRAPAESANLVATTAALRQLVNEEERVRLLARCFMLANDVPYVLDEIDGRIVLAGPTSEALLRASVDSAQLCIYGGSASPLIRRLGGRVFATPGPLESASGGVLLCTFEAEAVAIEVCTIDGREMVRDTVLVRAAALRSAPADHTESAAALLDRRAPMLGGAGVTVQRTTAQGIGR